MRGKTATAIVLHFRQRRRQAASRMAVTTYEKPASSCTSHTRRTALRGTGMLCALPSSAPFILNVVTCASAFQKMVFSPPVVVFLRKRLQTDEARPRLNARRSAVRVAWIGKLIFPLFLRGLDVYSRARTSSICRIHADRVARGHRHHRHSHRPPGSRSAKRCAKPRPARNA